MKYWNAPIAPETGTASSAPIQDYTVESFVDDLAHRMDAPALEQFLVAALKAAIAFAEMHGVAMDVSPTGSVSR